MNHQKLERRVRPVKSKMRWHPSFTASGKVGCGRTNNLFIIGYRFWDNKGLGVF